MLLNDPKDAARLLIASLADDGDEVPAGWFTARDLAQAGDVGDVQTRRRLRAAVEAGTWERRRYRIKTTDGVRPVYHFRPVQ